MASLLIRTLSMILSVSVLTGFTGLLVSLRQPSKKALCNPAHALCNRLACYNNKYFTLLTFLFQVGTPQSAYACSATPDLIPVL